MASEACPYIPVEEENNIQYKPFADSGSTARDCKGRDVLKEAAVILTCRDTEAANQPFALLQRPSAGTLAQLYDLSYERTRPHHYPGTEILTAHIAWKRKLMVALSNALKCNDI